MNNLTDIASENQRQWKSINSLAVCGVVAFVRDCDFDDDEENEEDG